MDDVHLHLATRRFKQAVNTAERRASLDPLRTPEQFIRWACLCAADQLIRHLNEDDDDSE